jgi:hypothetical protein
LGTVETPGVAGVERRSPLRSRSTMQGDRHEKARHPDEAGRGDQ